MEPTKPLLLTGSLFFSKKPSALGDDAELRLQLTAAAPTTLADQLTTDGSLTLFFEYDEASASSYEQSYSYSVAVAQKNLVFHPDPANEPLLLAKHVQTGSHTVKLAGKTAELVWQLSGWQQAGTFRVHGRLLTKTGSTLDFMAPALTVADAVGAPGGGTGAGTGGTGGSGPGGTGGTGGPGTGTTAGPQQIPLPLPVTLNQAQREESPDQALWGLIRRRTLDFNRYRTFVDRVLCTKPTTADGPAHRFLDNTRNTTAFSRLASYQLLKAATEFYLMQEAGLARDDAAGHAPGATDDAVLDPNTRRTGANELHRLAGPAFSLTALRDDYLEKLEDESVLPYFKLIRDKLAEVPLKDPRDLPFGPEDDVCYGILKTKLQSPPLMELIWSYWHEEGGLVQTMNAISLRFQNVRSGGRGQDPLANLNLDSLRPMSNLIWGYIEDERNRLTLNRRNLEYQYEYGFGLIGRSVQDIPVAEHRTFFLRGFHSLLRAATEFFQQANFTTVIPDGFPILNHLREVHLTLAEGAHNQYGDLPWTARVEMLTQQWLLARPEVREFLGGRIMVPYTEPWMDRVDNMKQLQGWTPTNISHFRDLGAFGEQLLLSIRYGSWNSPSVGAINAANWAHYWREEIQRYIHAYQAVTGIDLASDVVDARLNAPDNPERYLQPAQLIERQNALQQAQLRPRAGSGMGQLRSPQAPGRGLADGVALPRRMARRGE